MQDRNSREQLLGLMKEGLEKQTEIQSAWVGGSTATGWEDALSDIDLVAICENPALVFSTLEKALSTSHRILQTWKVEDSPFPGFHQKFYVLDGTPETFYIDAGAFASLDPKDYREYFNQVRHGTPVVLFDKAGILKQASETPQTVTPPPLNLANVRARFEVMFRTFQKEALRGKYVDSFLFYQRLVLILVQVLRYKYSPQRYDFGLRYLERDLPKAEYELVDDLFRVDDLETLQFKAPLIKTRLLELLEELQ